VEIELKPGDRRSRVVLIHIFYDIVFMTVLLLGSPYIAYRILTSRRFRAGLRHRLGFVPRHQRMGEGMVVWIHGVSVGEIKTIPPLLERIKRTHPDVQWAISTTTLAGYQMARKLFPGMFIFYFPLDIGFIVKNVMRRINPDLIILMELEIWPNLLYEADKKGARIVIVNGRISEKSFNGYRRLTKLLPEMDRISLFSVQSKDYRDRLLALNINPSKIVVTGNIKYDGIDTSRKLDAGRIRRDHKLNDENRVLVAGSTHSGEEEALLDIYLDLQKAHNGLRLVLAPRHLERVDDICKACLKRRVIPVLRTDISSKSGDLDPDEILILDTIGELDRVYWAADLVFIGGSLVPKGGHNMMEPAGKGLAVLYGPHVFNFEEDTALLDRHNAAIKVKDAGELKEWIDRLLKNRAEAARLGKAAMEAISEAKGATERNFELLETIFIKCRNKKSR